MNAQLVIGLIGEDAFMQILIGMPDEFFKLLQPTQDALWEAVLAQINKGTTNIKDLIFFARLWIDLYPIVKTTIHKAISKL